MKSFYFDGLLPSGYKAIKQNDNEIDKNKYIILNPDGVLTSFITCDSDGYVETIENFKENILFHKRVFSDQGEYEEEYENNRLVKKFYSTQGFDYVEKYKNGHIGAENEPAIIKSNLDGLVLLEEWYEKTDLIPHFGYKHRRNTLENGKPKSQPARILRNLDKNKISKFYYQNDNLNDGIDGAPAIQEFDMDTNQLVRSIRMKNNSLYQGDKASIQGRTKENIEYEIHDKENLKSCELKITESNITKNISIKGGTIVNSEIEIDLSNDKEIISYISTLIKDNPQKLIDIFKSLSLNVLNEKYNSIPTEKETEVNNKIETKQFKKRTHKKKVDEGEEYGVI